MLGGFCVVGQARARYVDLDRDGSEDDRIRTPEHCFYLRDHKDSQLDYLAR
jgi:hypothetical protein